MSALIKPGDAAVIRTFAVTGQAAEPPRSAIDPREAECAALREEVARLTHTLTEARAGGDAATTKAWDKGHTAGLAEATRREEERVSALRDALAAAVGALEKRLDVLDGLAPALVRASLEKLFDTPERWAEMSEAMLGRQLRLLGRSSVVAIHVSPVDFADGTALSSLGSAVTQIVLDPDLRTGACRIKCKLGQIDLDVRQQWSALAALLQTMEAA